MITGTGREVLRIQAPRRGLHEITSQVRKALQRAATTDTRMVNLFLRHTSAGLTIQENADPSARHDLELFFERLVPFHQEGFRHTHEGPDDMPSHIKTVLMQTSLNIPCEGTDLLLGRWQGVYLWEHRDGCPERQLIVTATQ
jgi:secondary thiamine-phosphate synthase enzyme